MNFNINKLSLFLLNLIVGDNKLQLESNSEEESSEDIPEPELEEIEFEVNMDAIIAAVEIPKLKGKKNYSIWKTALNFKATAAQWNENVTKLQILSSIDHEIASELDNTVLWFGEGATPLNDIWQMLDELYTESKENVRRLLEERKLKYTESIEDYCKEIQKWSKIVQPLATYDELTYHVIKGLPFGLQNEIKKLRYTTDNFNTFIKICIEAREGQKQNFAKKNFTKKKYDRSEVVCYKCKKRGHYANTCYVKIPEAKATTTKDKTKRTKDITYLVDTGSTTSFIKKELVQEEKIAKCNRYISGFNGNITKIEKCLETSYGTILLHDNEEESLLIGTDLLEKDEEGKILLKKLDDVGGRIAANINKCLTIGTKTLENTDEKSIEDDISKKLLETKLKEDETQKLKALLYDYKELFDDETYSLKRLVGVKHSIKLTDDKPIRKIPYRVPYKQNEILQKTINNLLEYKLIRKSSSPYGAPVLFVKKKDGTDRFCIDYRSLNSVTIKDAFPMTLHDEIFDKLNGNKYFTTIDFCAGYWQVPMNDDDIPKTAFTTSFGSFEWTVMPFGLTNAPATFQRWVNDLINSNNLENFAAAKIDDVLVYSKTFDDHLVHIKKLLEACKRSNARLKLAKCEFAKPEVIFLGNLISENGVLPDPKKVNAIVNMKEPKNVKEVRSFLGMTNYYRIYIKNFASIVNPLNTLLKKNQKFTWNKEQQESFNMIKNCLSKSPILIYPDLEKSLIVQTDASLTGIGCCLLQEVDNVKHPVCYYSRSLKAHEKNYSVGALEALAMVFAAKKLRHFVYDNQNVIVQTDHRSLQYIKTYKGSNSTAARWWIKLDDAFSKAKITYIKGTENFIADSLSRMLITTDTFVSEQRKDDEIKILFRNIGSNEKYSYENSLLKFKGKIIVPKALRNVILTEYHENMNHVGITKMIDMISKTYYWPHINSNIARWCKSCDRCQKFKIDRMKKERGIHPHKVGYPWKRIQIDFIGPFVRSADGNCYILSVIDQFTKFGEGFALPNATGKLTCKTLEEEIFLRYGVPDELFSDRGTHFQCNEVRNLCLKYNIKQMFTSSYNPASNGLCERFNATLTDLLTSTVAEDGIEWCRKLRQAVNVYNSTVQGTTKISPYELLFGFNGILPIDKRLHHTFPDVEIDAFVGNKQRKLTLMREEVMKKLEAKSKKMQQPFTYKYNVNDLVLVKNFTRSKEDKSTKFQPRFLGPFRVSAVDNVAAPSLVNLNGTFYDNVNVKHLKRYIANDFAVDRTPAHVSSVEDSGDTYDAEYTPANDEDTLLNEISVRSPRNSDSDPNPRRSTRVRRPVIQTDSIPFDWLDQDPEFASPIESADPI